jgi:hypothetical protein
MLGLTDRQETELNTFAESRREQGRYATNTPVTSPKPPGWGKIHPPQALV